MFNIITAALSEASPDRLVIRVTDGAEVKYLYFHADRPVWGVAPPSLTFAAIALSQYAAAKGKDLHVEGPVSRQQLDNLDEFIQIWSVWRPDLFKRVKLTSASETVDVLPNSNRAVMAFSGGVDASFSLVAHRYRMLGRLSRDIALGVLVVGWDLRHGDSYAARTARTTAERTLTSFGVDCVAVATNWQQDFCPDWFMGFNIGVTSLLRTFEDSHSAAVFASDHTYNEELRIGPYGSHTVVNHLLGSPSFPVITTGGTHTRLDRVREISRHADLLNNLRVCYQEGAGGANCGQCEKCVRTQLEVIAVGADTSKAFPSPMTSESLAALSVFSISGLIFLQDILKQLPATHELYEQVRRVAIREAAKFELAAVCELNGDDAEALNAHLVEIDRLRIANAALLSSTSWRLTAPIRWLRSTFWPRQQHL